MTELELILFNVDHGLSVALIEKPENYVTIIDLGSRSDFSPLRFLNNSRHLRPDILFITHPHGDHISDVNTARYNQCRPDYINYQSYNWNDVKQRERSNNRQLIDNYQTFINSNSYGNYSGSAELKYWYFTPDKAKGIYGESKYINNSSYFIIYKWRNFKIAIPGDLESDAMEDFCNHKEFRDFASNSDILIAPHHGHNQGYYSGWVDKIGKPFITLISIQSRDQHVAQGYQSPNFAKGVGINGVKRYSLTTRQEGHISVNMHYSNNNPAWNFNFFK